MTFSPMLGPKIDCPFEQSASFCGVILVESLDSSTPEVEDCDVDRTTVRFFGPSLEGFTIETSVTTSPIDPCDREGLRCVDLPGACGDRQQATVDRLADDLPHGCIDYTIFDTVRIDTESAESLFYKADRFTSGGSAFDNLDGCVERIHLDEAGFDLVTVISHGMCMSHEHSGILHDSGKASRGLLDHVDAANTVELVSRFWFRVGDVNQGGHRGTMPPLLRMGC